MTARFRLGMFDPPEMVPYARIPFSENDSPAHRELALKAARESIVLLKNDNDVLPLKKDIKTIAVIGPNADAAERAARQLQRPAIEIGHSACRNQEQSVIRNESSLLARTLR